MTNTSKALRSIRGIKLPGFHCPRPPEVPGGGTEAEGACAGSSGAALAAASLDSMAGPPGRRNPSGRPAPRLGGGCFRAAGACAVRRWPGSLWQRRWCGPSLRAPVAARQSQRRPAPRPLGHERGVPPRPATLAAAVAASQLWAGAGNMPLAAYCYLRVVGRGSYGEVTLVRHRRDGRQVGGVGARQRVEGRRPQARPRLA